MWMCPVGTSIEILRVAVPVNGWFKERKEASDVIHMHKIA